MELKDEHGKTLVKITAADPNKDDCDEGVWVELQADNGTRPTLCLVKRRGIASRNPSESEGVWYLGVYRDARKTGAGCDLAISFDAKDGPQVQVTRGKDVKIVSLFGLVSLLP